MTSDNDQQIANPTSRWGIVLSGGNGTRLRDFVYRKRADYLPKQYLNFVGKRSMLEHTLHRAEKLIPAQQLLIVCAKEHLQFEEVRRQFAARPQESVIVQPENKDTAPGILLPLLHLQKRDPLAVVTLFPSDHFILEEDLFMQHVERAFRAVESDPARMVLLGTEPSEPDPEYGYILPSGRIDAAALDAGRSVEMFIEKPTLDAARMIMTKGALWNTLVLTVACETLLHVIKRAMPELDRAFEPIRAALGTPEELRAIERVYQKLPSSNFSKGVLERLPNANRQQLRVLPVRGVTWKDWGTSHRLSKTLRQLGAPDFAPPEPVLPDGVPLRAVPERTPPIVRTIR